MGVSTVRELNLTTLTLFIIISISNLNLIPFPFKMEVDNLNNHSNNCDEETFVSDSKGAKRSIAERRGFNSNAARINTAMFRTATSTTPSPSPAARSPRLTIPPGISPTALLDSPVMLPNSQAVPSPTTGSFFMLPPLAQETNSSLPPYSAPLNQVSSNFHSVKGGNRESQVQSPLDFSFPADFSKGHSVKNSEVNSYNDMKMLNDAIVNANNVEMPMSGSEEVSDESTIPKNAINSEDIGGQPALEGELKEASHATGVARTSEDGYNWRKYGQKQVKGSEYPRSYYKCTQPNCLVKKKVERSHDGQITEIIYKGTHNHAKPHPNHRGSALSTDEISDMAEDRALAKVDSGFMWRNIQSGLKDSKNSLDWKADGQERTSSTSVVTEISDPTSTNKAKSLSMFESEETPELSSTLPSHDMDEDAATQALLLVEDDAENDESEPKRRKKESYAAESNLHPRSVREPRVVVQIESDVDILDDGYRWRKYGQKVVKGNPNPRSYYKCTSAGCMVRKHVERASHNLKFVLTTYEGKHNHEVPTARTNNQLNSSDGGLPANGANGQVALALPGSAGIKSETHQTLAHHFDRKPEFCNEFLRPSLVGSFSGDIKFGPPSLCQMKYPSLNNTMPFGSYALNPDRCVAPQAGSIASMFPDFPMTLPLNLPSSGKFSVSGLSFNRAKPINHIQSFLSGQQVKKDLDTVFLRPKQEQKDDTIYGSCIPSIDVANASLTSSAAPTIYQRVMQNFPS
ncbi:unnamed protein product [Sphenostylis stenocarpa]|uniref:WRKY domain-containing protein n=1 Tax=Sphenostylis stenocarpa TaxID=92480 RepID=A0AA86RMU5_9FABA|nr:unnamed protein product [Sphenostylis stenocarpa]